jgi:O-acetyl-ADP-ribose deacetylase (regulator of RNase III)
MTKLDLLIGDITNTDADIIVFSAHPSLLAGSGVSGAIHKAAGKELEAAAKKFAPLKVGEAIITPAFNLNAKYVIHTICPRFIRGTDEEKELFSKAYHSALDMYELLPDANSIAFMSMGTGVYRWPLNEASKIAIRCMGRSKFSQTIMYFSDQRTKDAYENARKIEEQLA